MHQKPETLPSIDAFRASFDLERMNFSKSDFDFLSGKNTVRGKLLGFLTPEYYRREQLWKTGTIFIAYVYKIFTNNLDTDRPLIGWLLYSPLDKLNQNPSLYIKIYEKLESFLKKTRVAKFQKLKRTFENPLSEPRFVELPEEVTGGDLVFLSSVYFYPDHFFDYRLGFHFVVAQPAITKELMLVPEKFYPQTKSGL